MPSKVLFVINTLSRAGAEKALLELLERFSGPQWEVDLFVLLGQGELVDKLPKNVNLLNKRFSTESVLSGRGRLHMIKTVLGAMLRRGTVFRRFIYLAGHTLSMLGRRRFQMDKLLWRVLADGAPRQAKEYDLAVAFIEGGSAYYVADYVQAKKKAAFVHIDYQMSGYDRKLDLNCYLKFDKIFPISEETEKSFLEIYPECTGKTYVFHNIVNQKMIRERANLPGGFEDAFDGARLLTVGRLTKQKAYPIAIDAMKLLKDRGVKARWYVLGEGDERKSLTAKIEELGLAGDFLLLGAKDNPYPYYKQADVYVHATAFEGKSIAIQEAQTLARPIVVSDITSNRQQVVDGEDGLVAKLEPTSIADAVQDLIEHPEKAKRLGEAAASRKIAFEEDMQELLSLVTSRE
ncbi:MAG: glycosyltransferase [Lachnospiraceae bacterium]|nr:glycosyltransferase [Lachnospiraceae bacterium]